MMVEGWKDISSYISRATGRDISVEVIKKRAKADKDLKRVIVTLGGSRPAVSRFDLDRWITLSSMRGRMRKSIRERAVAAVQQWLALF